MYRQLCIRFCSHLNAELKVDCAASSTLNYLYANVELSVECIGSSAFVYAELNVDCTASSTLDYLPFMRM